MAAQDGNQGSGRIANVDENVKHITRGGKKVTEEDMKLAKLLQNVAKERGLTETQKYALGSKLKYASELRDAGKKKFFVGKLVFTFQVILQLSVPLILSFAEVIGGNGTKDTLIIITIAIGLVVMDPWCSPRSRIPFSSVLWARRNSGHMIKASSSSNATARKISRMARRRVSKK